MSDLLINNLQLLADSNKIGPEINIQILENQNYCIFGPSGVGKSVFLRCLLGIHSEYTGTLSRVFDYRSHGYVPSNIVFPDLTVNEYIEYVCLDTENKKNIFEHAEHLGLKPETINKESRLTKLSDGEKKRLALAVLFSRTYEHIFLDEPLGGLDPVNRKRVADYIKNIQGRKIIVSHHPELFIHSGFVGIELNPKKLEVVHA